MSFIDNHVASFIEKTQPKIEGTCGVPITSFQCSIPRDLEFLMAHTIIATQDYYEAPSGFYEYKIIQPTEQQLNDIITELTKLKELPSGSLLLNELHELLEKDGQNLVFSFILDEKSTPACKRVSITICNKEGIIKQCLSKTLIKLPENLPSSIQLPFFSKKRQKIIYFNEPIHMIIAHELIHCVQNLFYEKGSGSIFDELQQKYSSINFLKKENSGSPWCKNFFGGSDMSTWPNELQAMILGFQVGTNYISETQLLSELLNEYRCPHELIMYKNDVLIPFGHLGPDGEMKKEDSLNFTTLLSQTGLPLFSDISPKEQLEIEPISYNKNCNIQ